MQKKEGTIYTFFPAPGSWPEKDGIYRDTVTAGDSRAPGRNTPVEQSSGYRPPHQLVGDSSPSVCHKPWRGGLVGCDFRRDRLNLGFRAASGWLHLRVPSVEPHRDCVRVKHGGQGTMARLMETPRVFELNNSNLTPWPEDKFSLNSGITESPKLAPHRGPPAGWLHGPRLRLPPIASQSTVTSSGAYQQKIKRNFFFSPFAVGLSFVNCTFLCECEYTLLFLFFPSLPIFFTSFPRLR